MVVRRKIIHLIRMKLADQTSHPTRVIDCRLISPIRAEGSQTVSTNPNERKISIDKLIPQNASILSAASNDNCTSASHP